ncbi:VPLPA-CTERM sorting domain-containing protein [Hyphococcus sp. DH-69]|uniref:VPLPA-CTERM sorting domain-containing protein n=1 Tax=Hyphococcus formosus TaxID=3143534 RepID=UPI00398A73EC
MKKLLISALGLGFGLMASANAAEMTLGGITFDTDNSASTVLWAQGGVFAGNLDNRREACVDPTDSSSTVGATGVECRALEVTGFDLDTDVELDENNTVTQDPDVLSVFFDDDLINGDGFDIIVFETQDQDDPPAVTMILNGTQLIGERIAVVEVDGDTFTMWGFDFANLPFDLAMGATISAPLYLQTARDDENTPVGSSDIAAIVGLNFGVPTPEIPLPAAAWLFIAGITGLGFAGRNKRKAA